jgi:hypothetical protein
VDSAVAKGMSGTADVDWSEQSGANKIRISSESRNECSGLIHGSRSRGQ